MKIQVTIEDKHETEVSIHAVSQEEADKLVAYLERYDTYMMIQDTQGIHSIEVNAIIRIYSHHKMVYVKTMSGEYEVRKRLYEWEEQLASLDFVRISNTEIVNLHHVQHFDMSRIGMITIMMSDHHKGVVSRRYLPKIRKRLERMKSI